MELLSQQVTGISAITPRRVHSKSFLRTKGLYRIVIQVELATVMLMVGSGVVVLLALARTGLRRTGIGSATMR